jgi:hypothetical protein
VATAATKPYKGPESYQPEDAPLFFGRDQEADQLIARVASSRFTLLHALSGAGKTSLLNARVLPGLESRGWLPIRVLPQDDPVESIRVTTLQTLFPPLSVEREAVQAAIEALLPGQDPPLSELLSCYDALDVRHPLQRQLMQRRRASTVVKGSTFPASGEYDPIFCRLMRGSIEVAQLAEHLSAVQALCPNPTPPTEIGDATRVNALLEHLARVEEVVGYQDIVNAFYAPVPDLYTFFENITLTYGSKRTKFGLVLILDQFEELFTRFVDPGSIAPDLPNQPLDWRLRWELFGQLERLYIGKGDGFQPLPIRYLISMRDEYIAQLDPLRRFVPDLDTARYHLALLGREAAQAAVREPAQRFGYQYSEECFAKIIDQLTKEDRYIEPTHLQIVCEKLWLYKGRELSAQSQDGGDQLPRIEAQELESLNGAAGILRTFFREFLDELKPEMRVEVLDMLELLVTSHGTRNIVEQNDLTHPKFHNATLRKYLLSRLEQRAIVRLESRLGGQFAEITHEFLIGPILEALRAELTANPDYSRFRYALRVLDMFEGVDFRGRTGRLLKAEEFWPLHQSRSRIRWDDWSVELMLRSAVVLGVLGADLEFWATEYENLPLNVERLVARMKDGTTHQVLTFEELRAVGAATDGPLPEHVGAIMLRSLLSLAADSDRDEIVIWILKLVNHGTT